VINEILPGEAAAAEAFHDPPDVRLFPEEQDAVAGAVDKRRREFATARACARDALAQLGFPPAPVPRRGGGAPRWPDGVTGSITHCAGYRACAVARTPDVASIGIDAEPNEATPPGVLATISDRAERAQIARLSAEEPAVAWDRLLFSAKESVYKTWYPLTGRWLGFDGASISFNPTHRTFSARLLEVSLMINGNELKTIHGHWMTQGGLLITAISIHATKVKQDADQITRDRELVTCHVCRNIG
jgi:4'-phosphopantetheinyl transferase EntD